MEAQRQERGGNDMKRVTKIIALASIFSFILFYSSFQQRLQLLSMYSNLVDKKYMFLLCNGIVGFILGNFEILLHGRTIKNLEETREVKEAVASTHEQDKESVALSRGGEEEEEEVVLVVTDDDGILVPDLEIIRTDNDHGKDDGDDYEMKDSLLSSKDLNKKCEDFIKKVMAEIRQKAWKFITL